MRFDARHDDNHRPLFGSYGLRQASAGGAQRNRLRHPSLQLLQAVLRLAGPQADLICHAERPWASITFEGTRHSFTLQFVGAEGAAAADAFIAALPDHEFTVRGQMVADAAVSEVVHLTTPDERVMVDIDLLVLSDV